MMDESQYALASSSGTTAGRRWPTSISRRSRGGARRLTYAWFHLPETPPATVAGRLAAQLPVYRQFTNPGLRVRGGQTLEIATYRALQRLDADFFG